MALMAFDYAGGIIVKELIIGQHINIIIVKISFLDSMKGEPS